MKMFRFVCLALLAACAVALLSPRDSTLFAVGIDFGNFCPASGLNLVGSASVSNCQLALTSAGPFQAGAAWSSAPQAVQAGFTTTFQFQITNASTRRRTASFS